MTCACCGDSIPFLASSGERWCAKCLATAAKIRDAFKLGIDAPAEERPLDECPYQPGNPLRYWWRMAHILFSRSLP